MLKRSQLDYWSLKIKKRDNYTCQRCEKQSLRGKNCHAHHKKPKELYPELALDLNNGETLCTSCHMLKHWENEDYRNNLVEMHKGHVHSEEQKRKNGDAHRGMKRSDEGRKNMSIAAKKKGYTSNLDWKGRKHTEETKQKQRLAKLGKKASEETRRKMSETAKRKCEDPKVREQKIAILREWREENCK